MTEFGLQLYSLKKYTKEDFLGTIKKVSEIGFSAVEFAGFFGVKAKELKKHLDNLGMKPCGSHTGLDLLTDEFSKTIEYNLEIGNKYVFCPFLPADIVKDEFGWKKVSELFNEIGVKCKDMGVQFGYHNHAFEFEVFNGKTGYDILAENTDGALVSLQLDTFWAEYAGYDPLTLIDKYKKRMSLLHLKEMKNLKEKIDTSAGYGISNTDQIVQKAKDIGIKYIILEQEHFESENHFDGVRKGLEYVTDLK